MKVEKMLKYLVILVITYYVFTYLIRVMGGRRSGPGVQFNPYLDRVDGLYGRARPGPVVQPYPQLYRKGPAVPYDSPGWILSNNGNPGYV